MNRDLTTVSKIDRYWHKLHVVLLEVATLLIQGVSSILHSPISTTQKIDISFYAKRSSLDGLLRFIDQNTKPKFSNESSKRYRVYWQVLTQGY